MPDGSTVNAQIVDSVADVVTLSSGIAPAQSFGMLDAIFTETLGMAMYNAVSRQQGASMIGSAATTSSCAKMLGVPLRGPSPPPGPPVPGEPLAEIAAATTTAMADIDFLQNAAGSADTEAQLARTNLKLLKAEAHFPPVKPAQPMAGPVDAVFEPGQSLVGQIVAHTTSASLAIRYLQHRAALPGTFDSAMAQNCLALLDESATYPPDPVEPDSSDVLGKGNPGNPQASSRRRPRS